MPNETNLIVNGQQVRQDGKSEYVCLTDLARLQGGEPSDHIRNWLRNADTIDFISVWERQYNTSFDQASFEELTRRAGRNSFTISAAQLIDMGCIGILSKRGRYGGTYAAIQWAVHFANWMSPEFYLATLDSYLKMQGLLYGKEAIQQRFSRELAAKNYGLITQANDKRKIPTLPHPDTAFHTPGDSKKPVRRHLKQVDADIINVAIWGLTAKQWRTKFPRLSKKKNMRDYATAEELQVLSAIQVIMRQLQEDQYTREEKLDRLKNKAEELIEFYCDTDEKHQKLVQARLTRGW